MELSIKILENDYRIVTLSKDHKNELTNLFEKNLENLRQNCVLMSQLNAEQIIEYSLTCTDFSVVIKNNNIIGVIYLKPLNKFHQLSFWLDENCRDTSVFSEIVSLYLKSLKYEKNLWLVYLFSINKSKHVKQIVKRNLMKLAYKENKKIPLFDQKKVTTYNLYYKIINDEYFTSYDQDKIEQTKIDEIQQFCLDLHDYSFKRNNFFIKIHEEFYYWSGIDLNDDQKEIMFINVGKTKSIANKILKKILIFDDYKLLYEKCKTLFIVLHPKKQSFSLMFQNEKDIKWLHFTSNLI